MLPSDRASPAALAGVVILMMVAPYAFATSPVKAPKNERPSCVAARAWLGNQPRVINFSVRGRAKHKSERVTFSLVRYSVKDPRGGPGIHMYSRKPLTIGRGGGAACILRHRVLGCHARASGSVKIKGRLVVSSGKRCGKRIEI